MSGKRCGTDRMQAIRIDIVNERADPMIGGNMNIVAARDQFLAQGQCREDMPSGAAGNEKEGGSHARINAQVVSTATARGTTVTC